MNIYFFYPLRNLGGEWDPVPLDFRLALEERARKFFGVNHRDLHLYCEDDTYNEHVRCRPMDGVILFNARYEMISFLDQRCAQRRLARCVEETLVQFEYEGRYSPWYGSGFRPFSQRQKEELMGNPYTYTDGYYPVIRLNISGLEIGDEVLLADSLSAAIETELKQPTSIIQVTQQPENPPGVWVEGMAWKDFGKVHWRLEEIVSNLVGQPITVHFGQAAA